jgi:hypothetical protein
MVDNNKNLKLNNDHQNSTNYSSAKIGNTFKYVFNFNSKITQK